MLDRLYADSEIRITHYPNLWKVYSVSVRYRIGQNGIRLSILLDEKAFTTLSETTEENFKNELHRLNQEGLADLFKGRSSLGDRDSRRIHECLVTARKKPGLYVDLKKVLEEEPKENPPEIRELDGVLSFD